MIFSRLDLDTLQQRLAGTPLQDWAFELPGQLDALDLLPTEEA